MLTGVEKHFLSTKGVFPLSTPDILGGFFGLTFGEALPYYILGKELRILALNGEAYYRAAIELCDLHPGKRFCDMLGEDAVVGGAMRQYFTGKFRELELMGWHTFAERMAAEGQKDWLGKIQALDDRVMIGFLEKQILEGAGGVENRGVLEGAVKALQGLASAAKIQAENESAAVAPPIEIRFIPSLNKPIEPETWEKILAEKDPSLVRYFGTSKKGGKE